MPNIKVVHLTSVHPRYDTRVFHKMCISMANQGFDVTLVVADGKGNSIESGVNIIDVGKFDSRFDRVVKATKKVYQKGLELNGDLYHLHDPELLHIGLKLKRAGKQVIFDSHEDVPKQLLGKPYLNKPILWMLSKAYENYEKFACSRFNGIITATSFIQEKFEAINSKVIAINNFPILKTKKTAEDWNIKKKQVCYVGSLTRVRGIVEICSAMEQLETDVVLELAGNFGERNLEENIRNLKGWEKVNAIGYADRSKVDEILAQSMAGLVTLHPLINYLDALPVKMFEYMNAGIPVIASDFPLWREIVEQSNCGILVDPLNPEAIAKAIDFIVMNPDKAKEMGLNGQKAVHKMYNWQNEELKMIDFYQEILNN